MSIISPKMLHKLYYLFEVTSVCYITMCFLWFRMALWRELGSKAAFHYC